MPTKPKPKDPPEVEVGVVSEELEVPVASDVVFRKVWRIQCFHKTIAKRDMIDSPQFQCSVNGVTTFWNMSVRFWKGSNGKKITNPVVVCLNLTGSKTEETGQARVRYQFGVWDARIKHWECCPISNVVLNLQNSKELLSVGYRSLGILKRHLNSEKDVSVMLKLQIIQSDEESHSLSQDMGRFLQSEEEKDTTVECIYNETEQPLKIHSWIIKIRSIKLYTKLIQLEEKKFKLDLSEHHCNLITEFIRYIYTDKVDNAEMHACKLLPLSVRFKLPGLMAICERALLESLTPNNVANILLLADQCNCENLRKAALHYCENSSEIKECFHGEKTLAWRVMEMVNPDLFLEACESFGSSSSNLNSTPGSWSD